MIRHLTLAAVLGAMTLDMLAVIFADPTVLLAIFAEEILEVGPRGYGLLRASMAIGVFIKPGRMTLARIP